MVMNCPCSCPGGRDVGCCGRCGKSCVRITTVILYILVVAVGLAILGVRIWLYFSKPYTEKALEEVKVIYDEGTHTYKFMWVIFYIAFLIALGIYFIAVGIIGVSFVFTQTLQMFLISLISSVFVLLLCASIGVGLPVCTAIDEKSEGEVGILFARSVASTNYTHRLGDNGSFWNLTDLIQSSEKCCGVNGPDDYTRSGFVSTYKISYPYSCCALRIVDKPKEYVQSQDVNWITCRSGGFQHYRQGCGDKLRNATELADKPGEDIIVYTYGAALVGTALIIISVIFLVILYLNPT